jgi:FAD/FMN-containing dehydrogenase
VPVSRLPQLVYETKKDLSDSNLRATIVGHVGDGNFHALILFDPEKESDATNGAVHRLVHRAIAMDGTCMSKFTDCYLLTSTDPVAQVLVSMGSVLGRKNI